MPTGSVAGCATESVGNSVCGNSIVSHGGLTLSHDQHAIQKPNGDRLDTPNPRKASIEGFMFGSAPSVPIGNMNFE